MKIEGTCEATELGKRVYLPGITLRDTCPACGAEYTKDLGDSYLSYPTVGQAKIIHGYCGACEHEWVLGSVVVRVTLEIAESHSLP